MFRCDWCENYRDKCEARENPKSPNCGLVCDECADAYEYEQSDEGKKYLQRATDLKRIIDLGFKNFADVFSLQHQYKVFLDEQSPDGVVNLDDLKDVYYSLGKAVDILRNVTWSLKEVHTDYLNKM